MQKFAFFARLNAMPGKEKELEAFIEQGDRHTKTDVDIVHSFSMKEANGVYCLFDIFETEAARANHLRGPAAEMLASVSESLLREAPVIHLLEIVRQK